MIKGNNNLSYRQLLKFVSTTKKLRGELTACIWVFERGHGGCLSSTFNVMQLNTLLFVLQTLYDDMLH